MVEVPRFGPYLLEAELGRGAMGVVYRAVDTRAGRRVALKVVPAGGPEPLARFAAEAEAAARLRHKNVVAVHDFLRAQGQLGLVSELVEGPSLGQVLARGGPLEAGRAADLIARLCEGVAHAHAAGVLHRDIKPDNVLLEGQEPRLTDFGVARLGAGVLTQTGQVLGTPSYMSPEQASGERGLVDVRADVYALGATLYALLTGRPPFAEGSVLSTLSAVICRPPLPPSTYVALPAELEAITLRCLAKDPEERYPSASALRDALEAWRLDGSAQELTRRRRGTLRFVVGAGLGVVVVGGGLALALVLSGSPAPPSVSSELERPSLGAEPPRLSPARAAELYAEGEARWRGDARLDPDAALAAYLAAAPLEPRAWACVGEIVAVGRCDPAALARARAALVAAAGKGDPRALRACARALAAAPGGEFAEAEEWCRRLAQLEPIALVWLGERALRAGDRSRAEALFREAAEAGEAEARVRLGRFLLDERGDRVIEGVPLVQAEFEAGLPSGIYEWGEANYGGWGVVADKRLGQSLIERAAQRGSLAACYRLGILEGAQADSRWLLRSAAGEDPRAMVALSRALLARGDEASRVLARRWAERAETRGDESGLIAIALAEVRGRQAPQDVARGLKALRRLAARGSRTASLRLGIELAGLGHVEEARAQLRPLAAEGLAAAMTELGSSLLGSERPAEREEGLRLLEAALAKNHGEAGMRLGAVYRERDPARAVGYYDRAFDLGVPAADALRRGLRATHQLPERPRPSSPR